VGFVLDRWHRSRVYELLRLGGYVAFDLPRTVTGIGCLLLAGIAATHVYLLAEESALPLYFVSYAVVLIVGCLLTIGAMWLKLNPSVPQSAWFLGSLLSAIFVGLYLVSRAVSLPGLVGLTGRWDFAPGTFAAAFAVGFIAVHASVLLGINVAYPQERNWHD
jgi:hypothetical protein